MNIIYFETNYKNGLIYILIHMEVKSNKMLFNSRDWLSYPFIFNSVLSINTHLVFYYY